MFKFSFMVRLALNFDGGGILLNTKNVARKIYLLV